MPEEIKPAELEEIKPAEKKQLPEKRGYEGMFKPKFEGQENEPDVPKLATGKEKI